MAGNNLEKLALTSLFLEGDAEMELRDRLAKRLGLPSPDIEGLKAWVGETLQEKGLPADEESVRMAILENKDLLRLAFILAGRGAQ